MQAILTSIIITIAILLGIYGYDQEMKANDLEVKIKNLEMQTKDLQSRLERQTEETIRLIHIRNKQHETIKKLENRISMMLGNNQNHPIQSQNSVNNQVEEQATHICRAKDGGYYYSSSSCGTKRNAQKADLFLNQARTAPNSEQKSRTNSTTEKQQAPQRNTRSDDYSTIRKRLSKQCDHLKYGSLERRNCRKHLKQGFSKTCYSKREMSKPFRRANCSLADSFPVVE